MKRILLASAASMLLLVAATSASAGGIAYVAQFDPWGVGTNPVEMDAAFGAGNWTQLNSYDNSMFSGGYDFIFVDGGNDNGTNFSSWLNGGGAAAAETYVTNGGALFLNAAYNEGDAFTNTGFGSSLHYGADWSGSADLTLAAITAGLDAGTGTSFSGSSFSHNTVGTGAGFTTFITGSQGVILAGGSFGAGYLLVGGETTTNFHYGTNPSQLRVNELLMAANGATGISAAPEPASWAMMLTGFFGMGALMRRRRQVLAAAV